MNAKSISELAANRLIRKRHAACAMAQHVDHLAQTALGVEVKRLKARSVRADLAQFVVKTDAR
ncbi:hypothetical protein [Caballeronia udeis]|uniref:hypothetical protein n=1 Tax=Caballeronia udeis TaxID=1232866 RepID=UPI0007829545|nr:hypothetical protein [Caballeronia udeis]